MRNMKLKERADKLKTDIPAVLLALSCKETPLLAKILAGVTVCYALSPIDLIPDFIPVLGYLDDVIILPFLIMIIAKMIPKKVFDQCREQAENLWEQREPKRWYYAIPILLIWLLLVLFIVKMVFLR